MKIEVNLNCTHQEFYDYLIQSLIIDIFKYTEEFRLKENLHPGFIYKKKVKDKYGKEFDAEVEIINLDENHFYKCNIKIGSNINSISYEIDEDLKGCKVIYIEEMSSNKKIINMNYKVMSFILNKSYKKKMRRMLMMMEEYIKRSKE